MTSMVRNAAFSLLRHAKAGTTASMVEATATTGARNSLVVLGATQVQVRNIGSWIPEFWGKKSKYTEGTEFLGTPKNHLDLIKKRPISPDVFAIDHVGLHYKMPVAALSSITNRVTGLGMTGGLFGLAILSGGDALASIEAMKAAAPLLVAPMKVALSFPIIYHYACGLRHLVWDMYHIGNQTDKSLLDKDAVESSSNALFAAAIVASGLVAAL
jgi:succinate dehydrogenase (ubiquinone) cytochrome b560 subunit